MEEIILDGEAESTLTPLEAKVKKILEELPSEVEGKKYFVSYRKLAGLAETTHNTVGKVMLGKVFTSFKCRRKGKMYCGNAENIAWLKGQQHE